MQAVENKAVEALVKLGFKEYQAKVYCALAILGQASATEVHKASGVPRPRVYDTLDELVKIGAVNFHRSRPVVYKAVEPTVVVERFRRTYLAAGDETIKQLEKMSIQQNEKGFEYLWVLKGNENIQSKIRQMIREARKEIFIRFFNPEGFEQLKDQLMDAKGRKVQLKSIIFPQEESLLRGIADITQLIDFRMVVPTSADQLGIISSVSEFIAEPSPSGVSAISIIIGDMRQSLFTVGDTMGGFGFAVWFGIPLVAAIQRAIFEYLWKGSEKIE